MFKLLVIIAFLIRLALMPISAHSDLFFINIFPNLIISEKIFDITTHVQENFKERNYTYYSPITYYTFGFFQWIYQFASQSFSSWMTQLYALEYNGFEGQAADFIKAAKNPHIYKDLFLAKTPYLIFDFASIAILFQFAKKKLIDKSIILLWLFNPIDLYGSYLMGQFDIIPTFFVLLAFYFLRKNLTLGILLLGISAAYKNFAFLFLIPTAFIYGETWLKRLKLLIIGTIPYILFLIPTLISDFHQVFYQLIPKAYIHYRKPVEGWALYSQTFKYLFLSISYASILVLSVALKIKDKWKLSVCISLSAILLVYALAPRISFHYLLWEIPLLILWAKKTKIITTIVLIQTASLASYKLLANHLQFGLFAPINPEYFSKLPTINHLIDQILPYGILSGLGFFIFLITNIILIISILGHLIFQMPVKFTKMRTT